MKYSMIRNGDFVKWNPRLKEEYYKLTNPDYWQGEPIECLMEAREGKHGILLDCANSCGAHAINDITEEEYGEFSAALGADLLLESSIGEAIGADLDKSFREMVAAAEAENTVPEYDPEEEIADFISQHAPKYVKRMTS